MENKEDVPRYAIGMAAKLIGVHTQSLRYYEKIGVIEPVRSPGKQRLYSLRDIERLRQVKVLMNDLGVNVAGIDVILRLKERIAELEQQIQEMEGEIRRLRSSSSQGELSEGSRKEVKIKIK